MNQDDPLDTGATTQDMQKKFRNTEYDRRAYAEETTAQIKLQRGMIDKLRNENNFLKDTITKININSKTATSFMNKGTNYEAMRQEYEFEIENEREKIKDIEKHIDAFRTKIKSHKQALGGVNAGAENQNTLVKQIKILENRLDKANQKFNEAIAWNKSLRQQIDSLRRERVIFDNLYKKLEKELHDKRKKMASIIESANSAYEERDNANTQILSLKTQAKKEAADFEKELKDVSHVMEKNKKALDFIKQAERHREETQQSADVDLDKTKMRSQKILRDKSQDQQIIEKLEKYIEDAAKIEAATQITELDKLLSIFKKNEEKNFNMFKYVNELSNEIEALEKSIAELKEEKGKYEGQGTQQDIIKKRALKDMEENLSKLENRAEHFEFKYHDASKVLTSLCNWIESLYGVLECHKVAPNDFTTHSGVTESNLMSYLGIIEERANDIITAYVAMMQAGQAPLDFGEGGYTNDKNRDDFPSFEGESEDEGEGDKPLTMEEFIQKAMAKIESKKNLNTKNKKAPQKTMKKK